MSEMTPEQVNELNQTFYDLNETIIRTNEVFLDILGPSAKRLSENLIQSANEINAASDTVESVANERTEFYRKQEEIYQKQLRRRGYDINQNKVEVTSIQDLTQVQRDSINQLDKSISKEYELISAKVSPGKTFRQLANSVNSFEGILNIFEDKIFELTGKNTLLAGSFSLGTAALGGMFKGMSVMTDAIFNGERGSNVSYKGIKEFSDSLSKAIIGIGAAIVIMGTGKIVKAIGAAITFFGASVELATKMFEYASNANQKLYDSYNTLSEVGITTSSGMSGLLELVHQVGSTTGEIEKLNQVLVENSKNLALLGGTASRGASRFGKVANAITTPGSRLNKEFIQMGINTDAQREHIIKYMVEEDKLGLLQTLSDSQAITGAKKYIDKLDALTMLTGASRKEMEEARAELMANENFRAALFAAEQDKSEAGQAKLKRLKSYMEAAGILRYLGDVRGATGMLELGAARGPISKNSATAYIQFGGRGGLIETAEKGGDVVALSKAAALGYEQQMNMMNITAQYGGDVSSMLTGGFAIGIESTVRTDELIKKAKEAGFDSPAEYLEAEREKRKNTKDKTTQEYAKALQIQQEAAIKMDEAAKILFDASDIIMEPAMKEFEKATKLFAEVVGLKKTEKPKVETTPAASTEQRKARVEAQGKANKATLEREKLEKEKGRGSEEAKQARIREMEAREEARRKALDEVSMQRQAGKNVTKLPSAVPTPTPTPTPATQLEKVGQIVPNKVTSNLIATVKDLEKFHPKAYWDYKQYSIGYGTKASGPNEVITEAEAAARLEQEINKSALFVSNFGNTNKYKWGQNQVDALSSFVYNGGPGFLTQVTAVGKRSNFEILKAIPLYNQAGGKVLPGLEKRRKIEADLFSKDLQAQTGAMFEGPKEGYFVQLHGKEFVGNEKHLESIKKLMSTVIEIGTLTDKPTNVVLDTSDDVESETMIAKFTNMLESKTDELLEKIKFGNKVDTNLLTYSQG